MRMNDKEREENGMIKEMNARKNREDEMMMKGLSELIKVKWGDDIMQDQIRSDQIRSDTYIHTYIHTCI